VETADDVADALEKARGLVGPGDGILVSGSLVTVGAAREELLPLERDDDEVIEPPDASDDDVDEAELQRAIDDMLDQLDDD
jgi:dihydrofolate synthase / folylpolyglutamate synthase